MVKFTICSLIANRKFKFILLKTRNSYEFFAKIL